MDGNLILVSSMVLLVDDKTSYAYLVVLFFFFSFRDFTNIFSVIFIYSIVFKLDLKCRHFMLW